MLDLRGRCESDFVLLFAGRGVEDGAGALSAGLLLAVDEVGDEGHEVLQCGGRLRIVVAAYQIRTKCPRVGHRLVSPMFTEK